MIKFGPWSTTLGVGMLFGTCVALLLANTRRNTVANRLLAVFILIIVLKLAPYTLGFAGFYDVYPWLSFAPLSMGLALGPLLYLHVQRLTAPALPRGWMLHLLPVGLQLGYYSALFVQPLALKNAWSERIDAPWIDPAETGLELLSMLIYLRLAMACYRGYQAWLDANLSNREEFRIEWLRNVLRVMAVLLPPWALYEAASFAFDLDYFQRFPLYVGFTVLVVYLGLEGWRHADRAYPLPASGNGGAISPPPTGTAQPAAVEHGDSSGRDWQAQGQHWLTQLEQAGWWRDPDLSLERLARHLGTNTSYLSRALNDGLGSSFNAVVNRLRIEAVKTELNRPQEPGDLLALAQGAGFNSKTSFNRLFKAHTGLTPSQYREKAARASANG